VSGAEPYSAKEIEVVRRQVAVNAEWGGVRRLLATLDAITRERDELRALLKEVAWRRLGHDGLGMLDQDIGCRKDCLKCRILSRLDAAAGATRKDPHAS
jgi:hypothetical protein